MTEDRADHLEENREQALQLLLFLGQGWDRPPVSTSVLVQAGADEP